MDLSRHALRRATLPKGEGFCHKEGYFTSKRKS